jgi:N-methylhydantoinase A/oxoprolinase/acetone carboxylase beta subunit
MALDTAGAEGAIDGLAQQLGMERLEAAAGTLTVANANMAQTIRSITVERGRDPREFALVAFGGAGPLHAAELATMLGIPEVLVPPHPGITSATGLLTSDLRYDSMATVFAVEGSVDAEALNARFDELAAELLDRLRRDGAEDVTVERYLDCRYAGQGYELRIPVGEEGYTDATLAAFHRAHEAEYGHAFSDPIEVVNLRVTATGPRPKLQRVGVSSGTLEEAAVGEATTVWRVDGELQSLPTRHLLRERLPVGEPVPGPAILYQRDTTIAVPPGWTATAEASGPIVLTSQEAGA